MTNQLKTPIYERGPRLTSGSQSYGSVQTKLRIPAGTTFSPSPYQGVIYGPVLRAGSKVTRISLNVSAPVPGLNVDIGLARAYHLGKAFDEPGATPITETLWPGGPSVTSAPDNPTAFMTGQVIGDLDMSFPPYDVPTPQAIALFPSSSATTTADVDLEIIVEYLPPENVPSVNNFAVQRGFGSSDQTT
ncbi:MAG: hypothetical protein QW328_06865 [Nitrososphaerota archaeon]